MKKYLVVFLSVLFAGFLVSNLFAENEKNDYVRVVYFHGDVRCMTCNKLENMIETTVKTNYSKELENGKIKLEKINFDKEGNEHYLEDYGMYNQTLIISVFKNGKEEKWTNADKIWRLVSKEAEFKSYVKGEVNNSLKAL